MFDAYLLVIMPTQGKDFITHRNLIRGRGMWDFASERYRRGGARCTRAALGAWRPDGVSVCSGCFRVFSGGNSISRPTSGRLTRSTQRHEDTESGLGVTYTRLRILVLRPSFSRPLWEGRAPAQPIPPISRLPPPPLPSDFYIICVAFRFSEGSIGRELTRQLAVFHPATA